MELIDTIKKMALVFERAEEFVHANAGHLLPHNKTKLIDLCTIALMGYEDHIFHWDQLKSIAEETVERHINQKPRWLINLSLSTPEMIVVMDRANTRQLSMPITLFMMTTTLGIN